LSPSEKKKKLNGGVAILLKKIAFGYFDNLSRVFSTCSRSANIVF
jgi:hypothetical protein